MLVATLYLALTIATVIAAFAGAIAAYAFISRDFDLLKTLAQSPYVYATTSFVAALLGVSHFFRRK
jgi:hypothetical protein